MRTILTAIIGLVALATFIPGGGVGSFFEARTVPVPEADVFTVRAGRPQILDVLANDYVPGEAPVELLVLDRPGCGDVSGGEVGLIYEATDDCAGRLTMRYCVVDGETCTPANVDVTVIRHDAPAPSSRLSRTEAAADVAG
ncbi:MAG: hypothetical protein AAGE18_05480 [Pseudomonadota bacterium]